MMTNRVTLFLLALVLGLSGALIGASPAKAASIYDGDLQLRTTLNLTNSNGDDLDVTSDYEDIVNDVCGEHVLEALNFAKENGSYSVAQNYGTTTSSADGRINTVELGFKLDSVVGLSWNYGYISADNVYRVVLALKNDGQLDCYYSGTDVGIGASISSNPANGWSSNTALFYTTFFPNYPTDYEGVGVPDQPPGENPSTTFTPKVGYTLFDDMRLQALPYDQDFCIPTSLGGCLKPKYRYTLTTGLTEIDTQVVDQNLFYKYQYLDKAQTYKLVVEIVHPGPPGAPFQDGLTFNKLEFTIVAALGFQSGSPDINNCEVTDGVLVCDIPPIADLANCFNEDFPFINLVDCVENMQNVISLLSFNSIKFGNSWETPDGCHTLTTLGDWLNLTNKTICPQIPQTMRDIITPFITLGLGLTTVLFLGRREGYYD